MADGKLILLDEDDNLGTPASCPAICDARA
jgi:hypothetical protein